jgi:hypothetical protein
MGAEVRQLYDLDNDPHQLLSTLENCEGISCHDAEGFIDG